MEKKRKILLFKGLTIIAILILGILVLSSCEQPGSVEDSSSQNKTSPPPSSVIDFNVQFEEATYQAPEENDSSVPITITFDGTETLDATEEEEGTGQTTVTIKDETSDVIVDTENEIKNGYVEIDDQSVTAVVIVAPPAKSVVFDKDTVVENLYKNSSATLRASVLPADASQKITWSIAVENEAYEDRFVFVDNGDGSCTLTHNLDNKASTDVVITATSTNFKDVSSSITIHCAESAGNGVIDIATDKFIDQELTLPSSVEIPLKDLVILTTTPEASINKDDIVRYSWKITGDEDCFILQNEGQQCYVYAKEYSSADNTIVATAYLKDGSTKYSNSCHIKIVQ